MAHPEEDALAMPPPQYIPDSQDSLSSATSSKSSLHGQSRSTSHVRHEHTPPTSQSQTTSTSQGGIASSGQSFSQPAPPTRSYSPRALSETRASDSSSPNSTVSGSPTHGAKRTASGMVKLPDAQPARKSLHSRTISLDTNGSSVSELTGQLRSKLSSAWSKVQSRESASQYSPNPNADHARFSNGLYSPRTAMANASRHSQSLSQVVNGQTSGDLWSRATGKGATAAESYERGQYAPGSGLAPAPELSNIRRANGTSQPPRLEVPQQSSQSSSRATQPRATTPTQQEQDAVESLMLMGSPSHPGRFQRDDFNTQPSPLRSEFTRFSQPMRTLANGASAPAMSRMTSSSSEEEYARRSNGFPPHGPSSNGYPSNAYPSAKVYGQSPQSSASGLAPASHGRHAKRRSMGAGFRSEQDVERMLDLMAREAMSGSESEDAGSMAALSPRHYVNGIAGVR